LISNSTLLDKPPHFFGPAETLNDGQLEAYLVTADTLVNYLQLVWNLFRRPGQRAVVVHHGVARQSIHIDADQYPRLAQADGEVIGRTPLVVEMVPRAIQVIAPRPAPAVAAKSKVAAVTE